MEGAHGQGAGGVPEQPTRLTVTGPGVRSLQETQGGSEHAPWASVVLDGLTQLRGLGPAPG